MSDRAAYIASAVTGAAVWIVVAILAGKREAWDSGLYWILGVPILMFAAARIAWMVPRKAWRWGLILSYAQAAVMFVLDPGGNLLPLGLVVFGIFSVPLMVVAAIVARVRNGQSAPVA